MRIADRIMLMRGGRMIQAGTAEDLYRRPASLFVARFFSDFNEVEGISLGGRVATPIGSLETPGLPDGSRATVCLRPGSLRLVGAGAGRINGRVLSQRFLGDSMLCLVEVGGLHRPLQSAARSDPASARASASPSISPIVTCWSSPRRGRQCPAARVQPPAVNSGESPARHLFPTIDRLSGVALWSGAIGHQRLRAEAADGPLRIQAVPYVTPPELRGARPCKRPS